jgi:hypothetical protein
MGYPGEDPTAFTQVPGRRPPQPTPINYYDGGATGEGHFGNVAQKQAYDIPLDDNRQAIDGEKRLSLINNFQPNDPLVVEGFSMLYLQRLANPLLPFDAEINPYLTVDGMSANASVFNGKMGDPANPGGEAYQPVPNGGQQTLVEYNSEYACGHFASLQRGFAAGQIAQTKRTDYLSNIMGYEPPNAAAGPLSSFGLDPENTHLAAFGMQTVRKNQFYNVFSHTGSNAHAINTIPDMTLGYLNASFTPRSEQQAVKQRTAEPRGLEPE